MKDATLHMTEQWTPSPRRMAAILFITLIPSISMWIGLYELNSAPWAFGIYHGLCLLPAIIWGRPLWRDTFTNPGMKAFAIICGVAVLFSLAAVVGYELVGKVILSDKDVVALLNRVGWSRNWFWPLSIYGIVVNPFAEELFWRGVILNELDRWKAPFKHFGIIWSSATYALFHYLIFKLVLYPVYAEIGIVLLACFGAILAIVYRRTGSIVTTAMTHGLLADSAAVALMLNLSRHFPNAF